jgi:hypothetical protein
MMQMAEIGPEIERVKVYPVPLPEAVPEREREVEAPVFVPEPDLVPA